MNSNKVKQLVLTLVPAAVIALASCSSTPSTPKVETTSAASFQQGVPGGVVVQTHQLTATVTGIDAARREVTVTTPDGQKILVECGPEVINFDQIRIGDHVKATVADQIVVQMAEEGAPPSDGAATVVTLAPKGVKPGAMTARTVQVTAKIAAIDLEHHQATLQFPDGGTKTVSVRQDVDLRQRKVGEAVVITVTELRAISVEQP